MHRTKVLLILCAACLTCGAAEFSGARALQFTAKVVSFGARTPGSEGHKQARAWILSELRKTGCEVSEDRFRAITPSGPVEMSNLICLFKGTIDRVAVFSGHYDTKPMPGVPFVGANDGGSSTGFLLEMARALSGEPRKFNVYIVFFDGEEAYVQYSETDGFYGSRHLARRWEEEGILQRIGALFNVDMIGDRDLGLLRELYSSSRVRNYVWSVAHELGYGRYFLDETGLVMDDHLAFTRLKVPAVNVIDFDYGPNNSWWHTPADTMDKLSANSFEVVGRVLKETEHRMEVRWKQ
jgi:Zn-dependent M28 family amino/carboxypeptidase